MRHILKPIGRRSFLKGMLLSGGAFMILPGSVLGLRGQTPPSSKLALAFVGIGGRGDASLGGFGSQKFVAFCDVDENRCAGQRKRFEKVPFYRDFRVMLDKHEKEIDGVVVSTPDHTHAVILKNAMERGKNVFSEKPLAHSIHEVRALTWLAQKTGVVSQLGNQGRSYDSIRVFKEWVEDGVIGTVQRADLMCNSSYCFISKLGQLSEKHEVPATLDWDAWLGGAAERAYNPVYLPGIWRMWRDFGAGVLGDWVCHIADPLYYAFGLDYPTSVMAKPVDYDPKKHSAVFPASSTIEYEFAVKGRKSPLKVTWYEGKCRPERPEEFKDPERKFPGVGTEFPEMGGCVIGDKGKIIYGSHGATGVQVLDDELMKTLPQSPKRIAKSPGHYNEFVAACKGDGKAESPFSYGGKLTEMGILGVIAMLYPGEKLEWNGEKGEFTNNKDANRLLNPPARAGWEV